MGLLSARARHCRHWPLVPQTHPGRTLEVPWPDQRGRLQLACSGGEHVWERGDQHWEDTNGCRSSCCGLCWCQQDAPPSQQKTTQRTRRVSLVGVTLVLEHDGGDTGGLAGAGVAHLDGTDGADGRLHEVTDSSLGHVVGQVRNDDLDGIGCDGLGGSSGGSASRSRLGSSTGVAGTRAAADGSLLGGTASGATRSGAAASSTTAAATTTTGL